MAVISIGLQYADHLSSELLKEDVSWPKMASDERDNIDYILAISNGRCDSSCMSRTSCREASIPASTWQPQPYPRLSISKLALAQELPEIPEYNQYLVDPPPSYNDAVSDAPPDYNNTEDHARVHEVDQDFLIPSSRYHQLWDNLSRYLIGVMEVGIDFGDTSNIQTHGGAKKKTKQAQKQGGKDKWAGSGDEGNKEGEDGQDNGGGGGGGGSNNGDGGTGDNGGGGDWNVGGGKKKKNKKGKAAEEEEEEKLKEEEEKRKEDEAANAAGPLSWADGVDANTNEDWTGVGTLKKGKRGKKAKPDIVEHAPPKDTVITSTFDEINLDDPVPKIDLSFGGTDTKDSGSSFGFGGWGNSWNATNKWDLNNTSADITDPAASMGNKNAPVDPGDANNWSFGGNKKNKKKTTTSAFDFGDLGNVNEINEDEVKYDENVAGGENDWGGFTATGKNDKKNKKKGGMGDSFDESEPAVKDLALTEAAATVDSSWGGWGAASGKNKDKKRGKKGDAEAETTGFPLPPPPPPPPVAPIQTAAEEGWNAFGSKKDKKKGKKGVTEEPARIDEPIVAVPEADPPVDDTLGAFTSKRDKKKGKKGASDEFGKADDTIATIIPNPEPAVDEGSGAVGNRKGKKKVKKGAVEDSHESEDLVFTVIPEPEVAADGGWDAFEPKKDKKKVKKEATEELPIVAVPKHEPEAPADDDKYNLWGKKDKKKGMKATHDESATVIVPEAGPEQKVDDDTYNIWGKNDKKKGKKGTTEELPIVTVPELELEQQVNDSSFGGFWGQKNTKRGKNATDTEPEPGLRPGSNLPVPDEPTSFWGKNDKKKGKKGAAEELPTVVAPAPELETQYQGPVDGNSTSMWGVKDKKKGKKGALAETAKLAEPAATVAPETNPAPTSGGKWGSWGTTLKNDKKGPKNGVADLINDPIDVADPIPEAAENDWMNWDGAKKIEKKVKRGTFETAAEDMFPLPPPPAATNIAETSNFGTVALGKKGKDGKPKKGKIMEPEPAVVVVPQPDAELDYEQELANNDWNGGWGMSTADIKTKGKDKGKLGNIFGSMAAVEENKPMDLLSDFALDSAPVAAEESWGTWGGAKKDKKKIGKKDKVPDIPPPVPTPPAQGLTPEPTALDDAGEDEYASFPPAKSKGKKEAKKEPLTRTATASTSASKTTKATDVKALKKGAKDNIGNFLPDMLSESPEDETKKTVKEETPARAAKGFWGGFGGTATAKAKGGKDSDKAKDIDEEDPMLDLLDDPMPKTSKFKADGKVTKDAGKLSNKGIKTGEKNVKVKNIDAILDFADEEPDEASDGQSFDTEAESAQAGGKKDDAWSFWDSSKKPGVKKADEAKKEIANIGNQGPANHKPPLRKISKEPEVSIVADEPPQPPSSKASKMLNGKATGKSTVASRIKAFEQEKEKKSETAARPPAPQPELEPLQNADSPFNKATASSKSKAASTSKPTVSKLKEPSPTLKDLKKVAKEVPGSFPSEAPDDDITDMLSRAPVEKKAAVRKQDKTKKPLKEESKVPEPSVSMALPTPPPETAPAKPAKKERARVVRDEGASSWGFWGAAPKKDVKKDLKPKDDADVVATPAKGRPVAPGLNRSKSTKTAKEKDKEAELLSSKSSGSDKEKKVMSRPSTSRGMSFASFLGGGGPPPSRMKSTRRPSTADVKTTSRRQSVDVGARGLQSPPPGEAPEMNAKAAKLMGMGSGKLGRKESTRGKQKAPVVPDPYAIDDDDDLVMVNGLDDPDFNESFLTKPPLQTASKLKGSKFNKRESTPMFSPIDDIVMVESGPSNDGPDIFDGPDDLAFVEKPRERAPLQRSKSSGKRPDKLLGLFGSFRNNRRPSEIADRPKSQGVYGDEDGNVRRKRTVAGERDGAKRLRRDDRKIGRNDKYEPDAEGFMTDGLPNGDDAEDVDAQREERRARRIEKERAVKEAREAEIRKAEERRARRREAEKARAAAEKEKIREAREKRIRKEEEEEARRQEDKRARRAAREDRRAKEEEEAREANAKAAERRSKRREREVQVNDTMDESRSRPSRPDRRRSHMDRSVTSPALDDEAERRLRHEMRKARRTPAETEEANRRKSAPPPQDYFDPRNASAKADVVDYNTTAPLPINVPYTNGGGKDHTSSWVESQLTEPPAPPPIEPTVMDPPPVMGINGGYDDADAEEDARRAMRRSRRHSKYVDTAPDDGEDRRRRRESRRVEKDTIRSSDGSDGGLPKYSRRQSDYAGVRTFDGRAANDGGAGKRSSWFKKMTNF